VPDPEVATVPSPQDQRYDVAVQSSATQSGAGVTQIEVTVTGLPADRTATLTARGERVVLAVGVDPRCRPTTVHASSCAVTSSPTTYTFLAHAPRSGAGEVRFDVSLDGADGDSSPDNNSTSVRVP
jgi:hypothetical protein